MNTWRSKRLGSYGIDAPYLLVVPAVLILWNLIDGILNRRVAPFVVVVILVASACSGLYTSRRGKFVVWARLLDSLSLRGDEHVVDLGCGRGAVLLMAAERLHTGRAVGVDLWKRGDQSGNSPTATRRNAEAEGVADRVDLHTADMTLLPFANDSFDVVLSNMAIHNIKGARQRDAALDEALRVLRPGGRLMIADIFYINRYTQRLQARQVCNLAQRGLGWRMWWGGPWVRTTVLTATKP